MRKYRCHWRHCAASILQLNWLNAAIVLYEGAGKFPLIAIPLFVLAGALMNATSISRRLIGFCLSLVGFIRGGLAMVSIVASMIFAEISGSSVADVAALGKVLADGPRPMTAAQNASVRASWGCDANGDGMIDVHDLAVLAGMVRGRAVRR